MIINTSCFLIKVPPESNEIRKQLFDGFSPELYPFQREFFFYHSVRNLFNDIIKNNGDYESDKLDIFPKPYIIPGQKTFNRGLEEPLMFEDLGKIGYRIWKDEFNGLDILHTKVALEAYGKLHALGMVLFEKVEVRDENIIKLFNFNPASLVPEKIVDEAMKTFIEWMKNNNYAKEVIAKVENERKDRNYMKTCEKLFKEGQSHEIQVVQHFDARSNNIMFNYEADNITPVKAKLVDFQLASFFPPFWDLIYFLAVSVSSDVLIPNYNSFIKRFYSSFTIFVFNCIN